MSVQPVLLEVLKQCSLGGVETLKVTGTSDAVKVQCHDVDKTLFVEANLHDPIEEFKGEFGITNLKMLTGLLSFAHFQEGGFTVNNHNRGDAELPYQFVFKGKGSKSTFNLMDINYVPQQASIAQVPWNVKLAVTKEMLTEFQGFASLYSEVDKHFSINIEDDAVMITFGQEASSTHSGIMKLADAEGQTLKGTLSFPVDKFIMLLKLAASKDSAKLMFTDKGLLGVDVEGTFAIYHYYLRQTVR